MNFLSNKSMIKKYKSIIQMLFKYFEFELLKVFLLKFFSVTIQATTTQFIPAILIKHAIDDLTQSNKDNNTIILYCIILIGLVVINIIISPFLNYIYKYMQLKMIMSLKSDVFNSIVSFVIKEHEENTSGEMLSRINNDIEYVEMFLSDALSQIAYRISYGIGSLVVLFSLDWIFCLYTLLLGAVILITRIHYIPKAEKITRSKLEVIGRINSILSELFNNYYIISSLPLQVGINKFYRNLLKKLFYFDKAMIKIKAIIQMQAQLLLDVALTIGWFILVFNLYRYQLNTIGTYVGILYIMRSGLNFFNLIAITLLTVSESIVGTNRVFKYFAKSKENPKQSISSNIKHKNASIVFENVSFCYPNGFKALNCINFRIEHGDFVELRGIKGSGKSTICKLLMGFYDNYEGNIFIGGRNIKEYDLSTLRSFFSYLPTNPLLLDGTISFNIKPESKGDLIDMEKIVSISKQANILSSIEKFNNGFDTEISYAEPGMSTGEKQRIALARALTKDTPILLLDEFNSNLDLATECEILNRLLELKGKKTIIAINHKEPLSGFDNVLTIKCGQLQ